MLHIYLKCNTVCLVLFFPENTGCANYTFFNLFVMKKKAKQTSVVHDFELLKF